jgi:hypothetical protein
MSTEGTSNDGRPEPRTRPKANGGFSPDTVFGDPQWVAEHLEWIRRHYRRDNGNSEAAA